jgi:hypothetical protein
MVGGCGLIVGIVKLNFKPFCIHAKMKRPPQLFLALLVIGAICVYSVHCTIDQTVLTSDYTLRGVANIAPGQYLQLTQDVVGGGSRVLYNDPYDVTLGFSISLELNISSVDGDYGDG